MSTPRDEHLFERPEFAFDYLDGRLSADERSRGEQHLEACPSCRALMAEQQAISAMLSRQGMVDPPPGLDDRILAEIAGGDPSIAPVQDRGAEGSPQADGPPPTERPNRRGAPRRAVRDWLERRRIGPRVAVPLAAVLVMVAIGAGLVSDSLRLGSEFSEEAADTVALQDGGNSGRSMDATATEPTGETTESDEDASDAEITAVEAPGDGDLPETGSLRGKVVNFTYESIDRDREPSMTELLGAADPDSEEGNGAAGDVTGDGDDLEGPDATWPMPSGIHYVLWAAAEDAQPLLDRVRAAGHDPWVAITGLDDLPPAAHQAALLAPVVTLTAGGRLRVVSERAESLEEQADRDRVLIVLKSP